MKSTVLTIALLLSLVGCSSKTASLQAAAAAGDLPNVKVLFDGASEENRRIALLDASRNGHSNVAEFLLSKNVKVNGHTLWHAVMGSNITIVKLMLEKGADVNEEIDQDGTNVFMEAVRIGNLDIIKLLIEKGANLKAKTETGTTAVDIAKKANNQEVVKLLEDGK